MPEVLITQSKQGQRMLAKFLIEYGFCHRNISGIIGKAPGTINGWVCKYKWTKKKTLNIPSQELVAIAYLNEGYTKETISIKMGVTKATIRRWEKKHAKLVAINKPLLRMRKIQPISVETRLLAKDLIEKERYTAREAGISLQLPEKRISKWINKYDWKRLN